MFDFSSNFVYKDKCYLYNYNCNDFRIVKCRVRLPGYELIKKITDTKFVDVNSEEVARCSLSRTKRNIREICLSNNFEYFVTLTINSANCDRYSLDSCQDLLKKTLKHIKRINSDFIYIFITEAHKDGAFHFHRAYRGS